MRALALGIALLGCSFSPDIGDGTLGCGPNNSCPPDFLCGLDQRCHHAQPPPPPSDARPPDAEEIPDASPDACKRHCMPNDHDCCR